MAETDEKICPQCQGEFRSWVMECPDCEVPLISPAEFERGSRTPDAGTATPAVPKDLVERLAKVPRLPDSEGGLFRAGSLDECLTTASSLTLRGIAWRVAPVHAVFVRREDFDDALQAIEEDALRGVADIVAVEEDENHCPACGFRRYPGQEQCPECGLAFR